MLTVSANRKGDLPSVGINGETVASGDLPQQETAVWLQPVSSLLCPTVVLCPHETCPDNPLGGESLRLIPQTESGLVSEEAPSLAGCWSGSLRKLKTWEVYELEALSVG